MENALAEERGDVLKQLREDAARGHPQGGARHAGGGRHGFLAARVVRDILCASHSIVFAALFAVGCGSRTALLAAEATTLEGVPADAGPLVGDTSFREAVQSPLDGSASEGPCRLCRGDAVCRFCLIQGYLDTYRCAADTAFPASCVDLGERVVDEHGDAFACLYCNAGDAPELPRTR